MGGGFVLPRRRSVATLKGVRVLRAPALALLWHAACVHPVNTGEDFMFHGIRRIGLVTASLVGLACTVGTATAEEPEAGPSPVVRAVICPEVAEREPVAAADSFGVDVGRLYCFTEIQGSESTVVTHAWIHEGKTRARVELPVRSARWRTWSSKDIHPEWTGHWQVKILDADGVVLQTLDFVLE
jgi:hypothetical protein